MKKNSYFFNKPSSPLNSSNTSPTYTFSETMMDDNIEYAQNIITKWEINSHNHNKFTPLFSNDRTESTRFLETVFGLRDAMHYYVKLSSNTHKLIRAQKLMEIAMKRLEKEFFVILSANRKNLDSDSVSTRSSRISTQTSISDFYDDDNDDDVSEEDEIMINSPSTPSRSPARDTDIALTDLQSIADCMIATGYGKECVNIYKLIRKSIIDETLYYLGIEKLNHTQLQKLEWTVLENKIKIWLHAAKIAIKTLFHGERILCDTVFSSSQVIAESCFTEISKEAGIKLFHFPQNFTKSKKILSPEKIFRALDLYDAISEMWPEIESIFSHESLSTVRSEAVAAIVKLGEAVRIMLSQFEAAIQKDSSKSTIGGGVHPLTRYVMNFLIFLGDYSGAISDILADFPVSAHTPLPEAYFSSPTSGGGEDPSAAAITTRLAWLILVLLCKLDGKAVQYNNEVALSYLFLANNLNYVVNKVRNSSLGLLMGADWIWKHGLKVKQYMAKYERMGWSEVFLSLPENPTADISPPEVKERFRGFNLSFEAAYRKQSSWVIPDPKLRDEVKISLAKKIVPVYRIFYMNHRGKYAREGGEEPIVRYAPEDLNNYLSDLFFAASGGSISMSSSSYEKSTHSSSSGR